MRKPALLFSPQFIQHTVGTQERAHPQVRSRELLFFDEEGELLSCEQMPNRNLFFVFDKVRPPHATQVPDIDALLSHVFSDLQQHPDKAEGTGQLLFEMCKGVRNMFHSCVANVSFLSKKSFS